MLYFLKCLDIIISCVFRIFDPMEQVFCFFHSSTMNARAMSTELTKDVSIDVID